MKPIFFKSPAEWRAWLAAHHDREQEVLVGYHKKATAKPSLTWQQSVDEALCYGWIDGVRCSVDEHSYCIRFTPRKPKSNWSEFNVKRVRELITDGRMQPAGLKAFQARDVEKTKQYSYEARTRGLSEPYTTQFKANHKAWAFFQSQ
ncbi:MAG: bacteriocin-protection protein, partial [Chloroflexi bacterium]|nr:bacteriocin-protection protein [Chloroflexota bacterium]